MASLTARGGTKSISWTISGLGSAFTTANYTRVGISLGSVTNGSTTAPSNILSSVTPTSSTTTKTSVSGTYSSSDAKVGTFTVYAFAQDKNNKKYWAAGSATVTVYDYETPSLTLSASATTITVTVSPGDFTYFKISCKTQSGVEYGGSASYSTSRTKTFTGLPSNTRFNIFCSYSQNNYAQYGQVTGSVSTLIKPTLYEVTASNTSTSIKVALSNYSDFRYFKYAIQLLDGTTVGGSGSYITSASYTFTGLSPNTTYNVFCNYSNNSSSAVDTALGITVTTAKTSRPSNFEWTNAKVTGQAFNLTAAEWNSFTARINAFRAYKGLSNYSFTTAYTGNPFTAAMYTQAQNAIRGISGYGTYIPDAVKGGAITAYHLNQIRDELNIIP